MRSKGGTRGIGVFVVVLMLGISLGASSQAKAPRKRKGPVRIAIEHLGVAPKSVTVTDLYTSTHNRVTHVYLRQVIKGEETIGAEATVNVQDGSVVYSGSRFIDPKDASGDPMLDATDALEIAVRSVRSAGRVTQMPTLAYRVLEDRTARLAFEIEIETSKHW